MLSSALAVVARPLGGSMTARAVARDDPVIDGATDAAAKPLEAKHLTGRDVGEIRLGAKRFQQLDMLLGKAVGVGFNQEAVEPCLATHPGVHAL